MKILNLFIITLFYSGLIVIVSPAQSGNKIESIYTDLTAEKCKNIESDDTGSGYSRDECPGVGGYKLQVIESDIRQTINIIIRDGKKHELNFQKVVSPSFSYTGKKAEWRVVRENGQIKPIALIVRYNFTVNPAISSEEASYLTVTKVTENLACATDVVKSVKNQNVKARQLADVSANKPCLKEYPWLPKGGS